MAVPQEITAKVFAGVSKLQYFRPRNAEKKAFFDGSVSLQNLGIFLPEQINAARIALGFGKKAVNALHDRMKLESVTAYEDTQNILQPILNYNFFNQKVTEAAHSMLTYGACYLLAGPGEMPDGTPTQLISVESPNTTYGEYDKVTKTLKNLIKIKVEIDEFGYEQLTQVELFLPDVIVLFAVNGVNDLEVIEVRDGLGFIPAVKLINSEDSGENEGSSEINLPIRELMIAAMGEIANIRVGSETYSSPSRWVTGLDPSTVQKDSKGRTIGGGFNAANGKVWAAGMRLDQKGNVVGETKFGQFDQIDPSGQLKIIEMYISLLSMITGIPTHQLGLSTDMPASAEALKTSEIVLVNRVLKKIEFVDISVIQMIRIIYRMATGVELQGEIRTHWRNPASPAVSQEIDAIQKIVKEGGLAADDDVVYDALRIPYAAREETRRRAKNAAIPEVIKATIAAANVAANTNLDTSAAMNASGE